MLTKEEYFALKEEIKKMEQAHLASIPTNLSMPERMRLLYDLFTVEDSKKMRLCEMLKEKYEPSFKHLHLKPFPENNKTRDKK